MLTFFLVFFSKGYNKKHPEFPKSKEEVMELILDCFNSAAERDIYTGWQGVGSSLKFEFRRWR